MTPEDDEFAEQCGREIAEAVERGRSVVPADEVGSEHPEQLPQ